MKPTRLLLCLGLCGVLVWFLADAAAVRSAVEEALALCAGAVIPAMFPFLVVSGLLISLGFGPWLSPTLAGAMDILFHLPGAAGSALLLGLAGGYPIGARTAAGLYRTGQLTKDEACRLLTFCNNANPAFFLGVLGAGVFGSSRAGLTLWLIHVLSALLTGLLLSRAAPGPRRRSPPPDVPPPAGLARLWVEAVGAALQGMLSVCAFVTIFYVLTRPLARLPGTWAALAVGLTELFSLTPRLSADETGFLLAAVCSGWGGLSVLCQTAAMLEGTELPLAPCVRGKAVQGLLSGLLAGLALLAAG